MTRELALKVVLWAIALYHVVLGAGAFLSAGMAKRTAKSIFGIELALDPAMAFVIKVLGVYAITFGIVAAVAATDPVRYRALLDVIVLLYVLRVVNKLAFKSQYVTGLHIASSRVWVEAVLMTGFAVAVFALRP